MSAEPKKLEIPEFQSEIPEYLLKDASEAEKHLLHLASRIEKNMKWQNRAIVEVDFKQQETNGKVKVMHTVFRTMTSKPAIAFFLFMFLLGYPAYVSVGPEKLKGVAEKVLGLFL